MFCGKELITRIYEDISLMKITHFIILLLFCPIYWRPWPRCSVSNYSNYIFLILRPSENFPTLKVEIALRTLKRWEFVFWPCKSGPNHIVSPSIHINFWWCMMTVKISFLFFPLCSMSISPPWIHSSQYVDVFPRLINNMDVSLEKRGSYRLPTYVIITPTTNFFCLFSCYWSGVPLLSKLLFRYR